MTEGVVVLDDGRGLACCCVAPVSVATPAVIQSSGDPELRGPCPLHHTNLRLRRENERLRRNWYLHQLPSDSNSPAAASARRPLPNGASPECA
jgi:hypothetical protein